MALDIADAGLAAADPGAALFKRVGLEDDQLILPSRRLTRADYDAVWLVGAGKATGPVVGALEELLGGWLKGGLVVVPEGGIKAGSKLTWLEAEHPVPGKRSFAAGRRLLALAGEIGEHDLVLSVVTGGSSALVAVAGPGISDEAKQEMNRQLLACGADIEEINTVRKQLSAIKGGRLAAAMRPACIVNFTVSDVAGDAIEYICDLTVQDRGCAEDAVRVLKRYGLWDAAPTSVRAVLTSQPGHLPDLAGIDIETVMLVTGDTVCDAMARRAQALGLPAVVLGTSMSARAEAVGTVVSALAVETRKRGRPFLAPVVLVACGGESTVVLSEAATFGAGGPNQEVALAGAIALEGRPGVALLAIDTDGADGGTEAAGGIVDGYSASVGRGLDVDLGASLARHESTRALAAIGDLVVTGRTQTNVNDLLVVVVDDAEGSVGEAECSRSEEAGL